MNIGELLEHGNTVIAVSASDLKNIIGETNSKDAQTHIKAKQMSVKSALDYINNELGFKFSESSLYKSTMLKTIPVKKFGGQLTFSKDELDKWAESKLK